MNSIIFLSFDEPNADLNWTNLKQRYPHAKRVGGVSGILRAHQACAELSETEFFFLVDADNEVLDGFNFELPEETLDPNATYVWRCKNSVNDLVYGYGAIKLYSQSTLFGAKLNIDLATSSAKKYNIVPELASVTRFNTTPLNAWRSAFRECVKLSSRAIGGDMSAESKVRLDSWCSLGEDREYGKWCISGARAGRNFGSTNRNNPSMLAKINDYEWLKQLFEALTNGKS